MKSRLSLFSFEKKEETSNNTTGTPSILTTRINGQKSSEYTRDRETFSLESMSRCSRFDFCSAPKCPLDLLIDLRTETDEDHRCEMAKATRHKYWESMPDAIKSELKFEGYFESEYNRMRSAKERWLALPEQKKRRLITPLAPLQPFLPDVFRPAMTMPRNTTKKNPMVMR